MKRKITVSFIILMLICSTSYAATAINGLYKNRPIVNVLINGEKVESTVPGQIIDGSTMLPLRAISEALGANVDWNKDKYQASITTSQATVQGLTLDQLNKIGESVGIIHTFNGQQPVSQGSGFIVDGVLVTNWHVVEGSTQFIVSFSDKQSTIKVSDAVFKNVDADLIGFKLSGYPSVTLSEVEPIAGIEVYSMGYPHGKFKIDDGVINAIRPNMDRLAHSTSTDSGSSGGIIIDKYGMVIGITDSGTENKQFNYAIPISKLQEELNK